MSDDFFLTCKDHSESVHLTDNKLNPPLVKDSLRLFLIYHFGHNVILETEHVVEWGNVLRWSCAYNEMSDVGGGQ